MLKNIDHVEELSRQYKVSTEDILLIGLNILGVQADLPYPRIRMNMSPYVNCDESFYFALANKTNTPFVLNNNQILLNDFIIGNVTKIENDDCASSYFRKNKTVITVNSNSRSECRGCGFCPNNLELNSEDFALNTFDKLFNHLKGLMENEGYSDLSHIERITLCTGCFGEEQLALSHLKLIVSVLNKLNFNGVVHYLGSEILSKDSFDWIQKNIANFMITFTIECFSNREKILKDTKAAISLSDYEDLIRNAVERGFTTNIIYVLGIDPIDKVIKGFTKFSKVINYFPSINVFQPHVSEHHQLVDDQGKTMDYYLTIRKELEKIYQSTGLRPKSWECYRPLWYFSFAGEKLKTIRI